MSTVNSLTASAPSLPAASAEGPPVKDAPAFDFYPERWLVGVAGMSDAEQLSYLRLLCHQWLLGDAGLPQDVPALKRLAGAKGVTPAVLAKLPLGVDGRRRNARLEVIRGEQRERIAKSREKITKMNLARAAGKAAPPKGGVSRKGRSAVGACLEEVQGGLQEALQGGRGEGLGEAVEESLQGGLEGRLREGRGDDLGEVLDGSLNGFLTAHRSPPTSIPEDANNVGAGAREAGAAMESAAPGTAGPAAEARAAAEDVAAAAAASAAEEDEAAARAAADAAADRAAAAEAAAEQAAKAERSKAVAEATPNLDTVKAWAVGIGRPPDKAEIWWHEHEARPLSVFGCWTDRDGNVVRRPQHALAAWWQKWRANDQQRNTRLHAPSGGSYQSGARPAAVRSDSANRPGRYA